MPEKRKVDCVEALEKHGVFNNHEQMPNGEYRFRLASKDGSSYIRTVAERGGWQSRHHHKRLRETYIVQHGWMVIVQWLPDGRSSCRLLPGGIITTKPSIPHNIYLPSGAIIHTVKHGGEGESDWHSDEAFDEEMVEKLTEEAAILRLAESDITPEGAQGRK